MIFDYGQKDIIKLANDNQFTVGGIEKVLRLSYILNDLNNLPEFRGKFLLKGGTAINLLMFDLPRLSVDLDIDFSKNVSKEVMLKEREQINKDLDIYFQQNGYMKEKGRSSFALDSFFLRYNTVTGCGDKIKIDINYYNRSHIFKPEIKSIRIPFIKKDETSFEVRHLHPIELFAGKVKAFYERCKPRDIYDIFTLASSNILVSENEKDLLRKAVVFYSTLGDSQKRDLLKMDPRQSIEKVSFKDIRQQLLPMLHINNGRYPMEEINNKTIDFISSLMVLHPSEELYLSSFYDGKYKPDILFSDIEILNNIENHPAIIRGQQQINDSKFLDLIKKEDFAQIVNMKDKGFVPSLKALNEVKDNSPIKTVIVVQKIFDLTIGLPEGIKLAKSEQPDSIMRNRNDLNI